MKIQKILEKPENIFLILCLFWGMLFGLFNPPFQAPDEPAHFIKMWGFTEGSLNFKKLNGWSGAVVPENLSVLIGSYSQYISPYATDKKKVLVKDIFLTSRIDLKKDKTTFMRIVPTGYTPVSYFPSFLILWVMKILNVIPLAMTYILRFCSLLTYLALTYVAIKTTPTKKWLFFLIALLPLNLYQAAAINTDGITFGLAFLFIAYTLKLAFEEDKISKFCITKWGVLITLLSICKFAYLPLILIYFIIPKHKFGSQKEYFLGFLIIFLINLIYTSLFVIYIMNICQNTITDNTRPLVEKSILIKYIIKHPLIYMRDIFNTTGFLFMVYVRNVISSFGWGSKMVPDFVSNLFYLLILCAAIFDNEGKAHVEIKDKAIFVLSVVLSYFLIITSVFLIYQYYPLIIGVQGRYLSPFLPLIFLLFSNNFMKISFKGILGIMIALLQFLLLLSVLSLIGVFY